MKSTAFFIDKANQYLTSIDKIISSKKSRREDTGLLFTQEDIDRANEEENLKLKAKLLFSEFDNGKIFNDRISQAENERIRSLEEHTLLKTYKNTLNLFIEHLNEFRN